MQDSLTPQATQTPSGDKKAETHTLPLKTLFEQLRSSEQGLTDEEARERLGTYGPNDTTGIRRSSGLVQFLRLFLNPLVMILILASLVSIILGDRVNASIIIAIVLLSNILNFVQTYNSQHAVEKLRAGVAPTATVLRDGTWRETPRRDLVPGDLIRLSAGDLVPADARLMQATDLHVQQAALTGESLPVEKHADDLDAIGESFAEAHNSVFLGTSVVSGSATALVTATGRNTRHADARPLYYSYRGQSAAQSSQSPAGVHHARDRRDWYLAPLHAARGAARLRTVAASLLPLPGRDDSSLFVPR